MYPMIPILVHPRLIWESFLIRYEVYNDCDLLEIGEPFAEQPYALAVQQGSHLQEMLSKTILELQKDRYFETLQGQFWNSSKKNNCPVLDDSEGITLQSLGGVFIATLVGLTIAMITLVVEVFMQKKRERLNMVTDVSPMTQEKIKAMQAFEGSSGGLGGGTIKPYNISSTMPTINN
jgi:ionotropic glutamate receptor